MKINHYLYPVIFAFISMQATANELIFYATSETHPVALVELYTSQGCSSCPPADKWLASLETIGLTHKQVVPLALHVGYWDYIGWKDQFAQAKFSKRQKHLHDLRRSTSVYTPQIMFNGVDVRRVSFNKELKQLKQQKALVDYAAKATLNEQGVINGKINFRRIDDRAKNSRLIAVLAENKLQGEIHAGENIGKTLQHSHVVRVWKDLGQLKANTHFQFKLDKGWKPQDLELVLLVQSDSYEIQQALKVTPK